MVFFDPTACFFLRDVVLVYSSTLCPVVSARHALISRDDTSLSKLTLSGPASLPIDATPPLNPALASFSIETAFFEEYMGNQSYPNTLSQNLFENLKERTGVPAEVRIGGITADSTFWDPNQEAALYNFINSTGALINTTLGPQFWNTVKLLPEGTKIVMTLDLESLNYTGALDMAEAAWMGLGSSQISRFEVGNEPDQYYLDLDAQNYTAIWEPWTINISKALGIDYPEFQIGATVIDPLWPYNTPQADAQFNCVSALAAGANDGHTAMTCSEHTYQYSVCDPTRAAVATLTNLVNHTRLAEYLDLWQPRIHSVRAQLGPDAFVIGEFNSVSCSGRANVSNTFGQAMWLLDTTLYAASINVSRVYVHQGGPLALQSSTQLNHGGLSLYNLWYPVENQNGPIQVFPAYSAYLFVTEAIGYSRSLRLSNIFPGRQANGSSITTAGGDPSAGQISIYGFWDETSADSYDYPTKLALLNLELYNQTDSYPRPNITIDISAYLPKSSRTELTTWAGQTFASGVAEGDVVEETVSNGQVVVEASSAALVYW
ncbi:glycoside hydrolase family 79 protein [Suillus subaureus]|uniref:Glycoside hydrolase family 79 protein n=1 Tax=Suillus subaureus TaxID=48587 RepID=A0A9P7EHP4_9AGAM|nr:glycoside hydrolase family 79 protein [Suillus subaureus]KAG1821170.1 glycoside hydrolase family 79 protein [Suillus subaureus]